MTNAVMVHYDFLGQELRQYDLVLVAPKHYRGLTLAMVETLTAQCVNLIYFPDGKHGPLTYRAPKEAVVRASPDITRALVPEDCRRTYDYAIECFRISRVLTEKRGSTADE